MSFRADVKAFFDRAVLELARDVLNGGVKIVYITYYRCHMIGQYFLVLTWQ